MRELRQLLHILTVLAGLMLPMLALAQDDTPPPSLGDVARKARLQKQKDGAREPGKEAAPANPSAPNAPSNAPGKDASSKDVKSGATSSPAGNDPHLVKAAKKVITNEEIPEHVGPTRTLGKSASPAVPEEPDPDENDQEQPADYWRTRILSQKNSIAALKSDIQELSGSIQYAGANCVSNCVDWNERQQQKQQQVEAMKAQLEQGEKQLEEMQEAARKQGYGNSVYDP